MRSFKLDHFEKVSRLYKKKKIDVKNHEDIEIFNRMIEDLKIISQDLKRVEVKSL